MLKEGQEMAVLAVDSPEAALRYQSSDLSAVKSML